MRDKFPQNPCHRAPRGCMTWIHDIAYTLLFRMLQTYIGLQLFPVRVARTTLSDLEEASQRSRIKHQATLHLHIAVDISIYSR